MAMLGMGIFYGGVITGVPVVTGVAEGVHHQKEMNAEAANETRMVKFYVDVFCDAASSRKDEVHGTMLVLKDDKVWLAPKDPKTELPAPPPNGEPPPHACTAFYIMYPDENRSPEERGLVSTISVDPPMLNWLYVDKGTLELRYGNRTQSIAHVVGPWDWTEDEEGVTLDGWEGFAAVDEWSRGGTERADGLRWALYWDRYDDDFGAGRKVGGRPRLPCSLERRILPEELRKQQEEEADRKMQVKSTGDLKTKWEV